jgi:hypothetical protein
MKYACAILAVSLLGCHAFRAAPVCNADSNCPAELPRCEIETGLCVDALPPPPPEDAGQPPDDAGTPPPEDAGPPPDDAGTPPPDDAGQPPEDAGQPPVDAGPPDDAGQPNLDCRGSPEVCFPIDEIIYLAAGETFTASTLTNTGGKRAVFVDAGDHPAPGELADGIDRPQGGWVVVGEVDAQRRPLARFVRSQGGPVLDATANTSLTLQNLVFDGAGLGGAVLRLSGEISADVNDVEITGSGDAEGLRVDDSGANVNLARCRVHGNAGDGVVMENGSRVRVDSSFFYENQDGVRSNGADDTSRVRFSSFADNRGRGIRCESVIRVEHNLSGFNGGPDNFDQCPVGNNVILGVGSDPFVARPADLHLVADTPTIGPVADAPVDIDLEDRPLGDLNPGADER